MKLDETEPHQMNTSDDAALVATAPPEEATSLADDVVPMDTMPAEDAQDTTPTEEEEREPRRFSWPTRAQLIAWLPFWGVILLGALLRFWGLGDKPLHHDESLHAYFSLGLMHDIENWSACLSGIRGCYHYDPLLHGPFQFHAIALVYKISQWLGAPDHGVNTTTVRIAAATLGSAIVALPYFLRDRLGTIGAWLACFLLAVSPSMVYFSRFAREDIYMACFTLLVVVGTARYLSTRRAGWLIVAAVGFALSYATKEATFLSILIFGSFLGALLAWELGIKAQVHLWRSHKPADANGNPLHTGAPFTLALYFLVAAPLGLIFFTVMKAVSIYITDPKHTHAADTFVQNLKNYTFVFIPWLGILLGAFVLIVLIREIMGKLPPEGRHGLARRVDPAKQPLLDTIVTMPWTHWFFALLTGWAVFLVLFTVLFTNIKGGIPDGIWQGLYYWLQQQQVARGGQPWYYYLMLIPLYEQIGLVFGLVGVVRSLLRPTRFRLFLVYWFVGNLFLYSWAAEKMPWLMIHITMPMLLLAAVGLEPAAVTVVNALKNWLAKPQGTVVATQPVRPTRSRVLGTAFTLLMAGLLLLPTLQNMREVTYIHPADGPHEMMVYVQTTPDVNTIMSKVDALDQKLYGGKHLLPIGMTDDATWPMIWYLRDYTNVCYNFPSGCSATAKQVQVIIVGGDSLGTIQSQYATSKTPGAQPDFQFHQYHMRSWWDEGYKPPVCVASKTNSCAGQPNYGYVGPWLWLSYGDNPPPGAKFDAGLAAQRIWHWWWERKPFGGTDGSYDMGLLIRTDLGVAP